MFQGEGGQAAPGNRTKRIEAGQVSDIASTVRDEAIEGWRAFGETCDPVHKDGYERCCVSGMELECSYSKRFQNHWFRWRAGYKYRIIRYVADI